MLDTAPAFASQDHGSAQARAFPGTQVPMLPNPTGYVRSWDARGDAVQPSGLEAAIAAAKTSAEAKGLTLRNASPGAIGTSSAGSTIVSQVSPVEDVIDLLSGDDEDASDSGVGGKDLRENGKVRNSVHPAGTSCNEVVVLDDDTIGDTCLVSPPHKGLESSEAKLLSSGPDKLKHANMAPDVSNPPESTGEGDAATKPGHGVLKDANTSLDVNVPPDSVHGGEAATKPRDDLTGRGDGDKRTTEPALA